MQTNILWTGREYYSLENCLITTTDAGSEISSTIIGHYEGNIYKTDYFIRTNERWEVIFFDIASRQGNKQQTFVFEGDGKGNWKSKGRNADEFKGCIDIDIPLTPFTNTLPIRRLHLDRGDTKEISVLYCDLLEGILKPVRQKYTCLSKTEYHYQNVPNDFEATIVVDDLGLVVDYPLLFVRTTDLRTDYP